jgi:hypothetical protein
MKPLQKEDFELLKDLYEEVHGYPLIELSTRETLLGGYYTGASVLFNFLEARFRFGDAIPTCMEDFIKELRVSIRNNGVDNAHEILDKMRKVLVEPIYQLPKWATVKESALWTVGKYCNEREFDRLASYQKNKITVGISDWAIVARWRLAIGV